MKLRWMPLLIVGALVLSTDLCWARKSSDKGASTSGGATLDATPSANEKTPPPKPSAEAKQNQEAPPGWRTRCESGGRSEQLNCVVQESAVVTRTGEIVADFSIRIAQDTKTAVALIQIPVGVFLPSGIQVQIDDRTKLDLPLQTCEQRGCFAGTTLTPQFLSEMRAGKDLKVSFDNLTKQKLTVSLPLNGFGSAFDKIQ